ncbi:FAD-dependent oxidoreductase [Streptomyces xanthochromogenes]|uniref:FAD-dependent oxidoreductase n=1 Tax=Streptomyces xanthochromogenes TaxID=67384 RepID=UPI00378D89EC
MPMSKAVVIGGGIAGLATAINLHDRGWSVTVVEKATIQEGRQLPRPVPRGHVRGPAPGHHGRSPRPSIAPLQDH